MSSNGARKEPISIQELLDKQRQEKLQAEKPKFLSKQERAAIALAKRAAEVEALKDRELAATKARDQLEVKARSDSYGHSNGGGYDSRGSYGASGGDRGQLDYGRGGPPPTGPSGRGSYGGRGGPRGRGGLGYNNQRGGGRFDNRGGGDPRAAGGEGGGHDRREANSYYAGNLREREDNNSRIQYGNGHSNGAGRHDDREPPRQPAAMRAAAAASSASSDSPASASMDVDAPAPPPLTNSNGAAPPPPSSNSTAPLPSSSAAEGSMAPHPPPASRRSPTPPRPQPEVKLTLAEMAAKNAASVGPAPLNAQLNAERYLGARAPDKRKIRKQSDKKFNFDWDKTDDTGLTEVDPIYAPYIPPSVSKDRNGGYGDRGGGYGGKKGGQDVMPAVQGQERRVGLFGRGTLAGFDREGLPGDKKAKGAIDERNWRDKTLAEMRDRDWRIMREDYSIATRGGNIPLPLRNWQESTIPQQLLDVIEEIGYKEPSAIQRQAIPIGLQNRDQIGIAETGSGKTAAFVIPMLAYISRLPPLSEANRGSGPYALVLAPTRELAQQIESETNKFCKLLGYKCVSIVGGRSIEEQQFALRDGAEIVIATPGRLKDIIERHVLVVSQCTYVVMDEADRMVSLGFEEVINFILDQMPLTNLKPDTDEAEDGSKMSMEIQPAEGADASANPTLALYRQTVMFSATMPPAVERLAKKYLRRPAIVTIGVAGQAADTVDQRIEFIATEDKKKARLIEILNSGEFEPPMIVFVNQKKAADVLMKDVQRARWSATTLHSGKNQEQREAALNSIRSGECDILVATDLAGRGIDVPDVSLVVNFQMSNTIEAYIHRIGRTGRAGKKGVAVTFINDGDEELMYDLKQEVSKSAVSRCPPELLKHPAAQSKMTGGSKRGRDIED